MPQRTFPEPRTEPSDMKATIKVVLAIAACLTCFLLGWFTSNQGYRVVDSSGDALVPGNAAQVVRDENARLAREVINKEESEAEALLKKHHRTMFVGVRDGKPVEYKGQKTFTNLTVEVRDYKVIKILGWY